MLTSVKVPKQFEPVFQKAHEYVSKYFKKKKEDPSKGTIEIFDQRYILIRAASMSVDFFETVKNLYQDKGDEEALNVARSLLFDIAHAIGKADAKNFHKKMKLRDPIEKLSAGPIHFSHSGWAFVDIFPESKPSPDENYFLIYDHPFSFESDAWIKSGKKSDLPVCVMNAGYSSGWCEESFGVTLVASEIMCKAKGDDACRFIMASPSKIELYIKEYLKREQKLAKKAIKYEIPGFFKRKQVEEELHKAYDELEIRVQERTGELSKANEALQAEINERKRAEEHVRLLSSAVEQSSEGMAIADIEGNLMYVNHAWAEIHGYESSEDLQGLHLSVFHSPEQLKNEVEPFNKMVMKNGHHKGEVGHIRKDFTPFPTLMTVTLLKDESGKPIALCGIAKDITDIKQAEEMLRYSKEQAEEANRMKSEFLANMSHEYRTPMNAIIGMTDLTLDTPLTDNQREYLNIVKENSSSLLGLLDDILDLSKIEAGRAELESVNFDLRVTVEGVTDILAPLASDKGIELACLIHHAVPLFLRGDSVRLRQILMNLGGNAVKFTEKGEVIIRVELQKETEDKATLLFSVTDTGVGIPKDKHKKIFDSFTQADGSHTREYGGIGLGLSISKRLVDLMGGQIGEESQPGKGSRFWFTVTLEKQKDF
jgi:PAS domain S-box-containing protein